MMALLKRSSSVSSSDSQQTLWERRNNTNNSSDGSGSSSLSSIVQSIYSISRRLPYSYTPVSATAPAGPAGSSAPENGGYLPLHHPEPQQIRGSSIDSIREKYNIFLHPSTSLASPRQSISTSSSPGPGSSSGSSSSGRQSRRSCWCWAFIIVIQLAIFVLALIGLACIIALAIGLIQRTPIYSEKALQDSGWTRRPITLADPSLAVAQLETTSSSSSSSYSTLAIDPAVTIQDFSPAIPALLDNNASPQTSSSSFDTPASSNELHLLILAPLRNAAGDLPRFFDLIDNMTHPSANTSLGFLVGDEDDDTGEVLRNLVSERMNDKARRFRHVSLLHKDFKVEMPSGQARHAYLLQAQRRTVMARARTYLLTATLEPSVDWVLWLDSDISEFSPTLFQDLLLYGGAGVSDPTPSLSEPAARASPYYPPGPKMPRRQVAPDTPPNDIIVPNAMKRRPDGSLHGFDMNNWAETPESLVHKATLAEDALLIEGNIFQHMQRLHLADQYTSYLPSDLASSTSLSSISSSSSSSSATSTSSHYSTRHVDEHPQIFSSANYLDKTDQRLNTSSPAYIGRQIELDGIGGVAALVRAEAHRMGAVFPAWVFDHQLETEAFGLLAKKLGARVVGLPNLFVLHAP